MALDLPPLPQGQPIATTDGLPTLAFTVYWQQLLGLVETAFNALEDTVTAIAAAQAAADAANAAATAANTAAATAQDTANDITSASELSSSYVSGLTITAADAGSDVTITISAHTRHYPQADGTTTDVAVNGGSLTGLAYSTYFYIYYDDAGRTGGAVTYASTTSEATAAQIGSRHTVGGVQTPAAAGADIGGSTTRPPGSGTIDRTQIP